MEIQVIANPYSALDAEGVPQGVVGMPGTRGVWIGAMLDAALSQKTGKTRFYFPGANPNREGEKEISGLRVVTINVTDTNVRAAIANAILEGSLIAVRPEDGAKIGLVQDFLEPAEALAREVARVTEDLRARKGKLTELKAVPKEATPFPHEEEEIAAAKAKASAGPALRVSGHLTLNSTTEG